ncbi:MAG: hypothetical protein Q9170_006616 [Blastenia crenularia]
MPFDHAFISADLEDFFTGTNGTLSHAIDPLPKLAIKLQKQEDLQTIFLHFFIPIVAVALVFNLWLSFVRPWEYHRDDARYAGDANEDWLPVDNDIVDNDSDGEIVPWRTLQDGFKEVPFSQDEGRRLIDLIKAGEQASAARALRPGSDRASRKRKAGDEASPVSDAATRDDGTMSPRARKFKIETQFGVDGKWVGQVPNYGSCDVPHENSSDQGSIGGEFPFTFRTPHPGRAIKSPVRRRSPQ